MMNIIDDKFVEYVFGFYGPGGLYPLGASKQDITDATDTHKAILKAQGKEFCGDSIDREMVRDILTELYGLGQEPGQLELPFDAWQSSVKVPGNRELIKEN
jgi:hypothetical protein